ncbi:MAG: recombinase family protein [Planctomycetota bacterium]
MSKCIAIYMRVSSRNQDIRSQEPDLKRWAEAQDQPVRWYRDKFTGKTMDRPGWRKLEADIRAGKVAKVVVWRLDRLGRTAKGLTALFDDLQCRQIGLVSLREGLDLSTPAGRLMAHVLASVAQYEPELRGERVQAGQAVARANGKRWGGSQKGRRVKVTDLQAKTIRQLKESGEPVTEIAKAVGLSRPTSTPCSPKEMGPPREEQRLALGTVHCDRRKLRGRLPVLHWAAPTPRSESPPGFSATSRRRGGPG